jgi:hypothetical protein
VYDLGLSQEDFYALTPRQFNALALRHKENYDRAELLMGISTSSIVNHSFCTPKNPYTPMQFMPSKQGELQREKAKPKRFNRAKFAQSIRDTMMQMAATSNMVVIKKATPIPSEQSA